MKLNMVNAAMSILARGSGEMLAACGVSPADFSKTTGTAPWLASDRQVVRNTLDALLHGAMDAIGVPRFEVSAEYVAAALAMFVAPVNLQVACRWMESARPIDALSSSTDTAAEPLTSQQMHALAIMALSDADGCAEFRSAFEKRVSMHIEHAEREQGEDSPISKTPKTPKQ